MNTSPSVGSSIPDRQLSSVVLPRTAGSHDGDHLAAGYLEIDAAQGVYLDFAGVVCLVQVGGADYYFSRIRAGGLPARLLLNCFQPLIAPSIAHLEQEKLYQFGFLEGGGARGRIQGEAC